jgi:hypothetical protein
MIKSEANAVMVQGTGVASWTPAYFTVFYDRICQDLTVRQALDCLICAMIRQPQTQLWKVETPVLENNCSFEWPDG